MKHCLGLIVFLALSANAYAARSGTLFLRAHIEARFKVDFSTGKPIIVSNIKDHDVPPQLKIEKHPQGYMLTVIHP